METVTISMPLEHWGKVLDVVRKGKIEILSSLNHPESSYRELLLFEADLLSEIEGIIKAELLI